MKGKREQCGAEAKTIINEKLRADILLSSSTKSCSWNVSGEEMVKKK
jgi:hypothetical protein